jgi:hypothetical protein
VGGEGGELHPASAEAPPRAVPRCTTLQSSFGTGPTRPRPDATRIDPAAARQQLTAPANKDQHQTATHDSDRWLETSSPGRATEPEPEPLQASLAGLESSPP